MEGWEKDDWGENMNKKEIIKRVSDWINNHAKQYDQINIDISVDHKDLLEVSNSEKLSINVQVKDD